MLKGFPDDSDGKESARNVGDPGLISGLGISPGEENGNPLQYSCLGKIQWTEEPGGLQSMRSQSQTWLTNFTSLSMLTFIIIQKMVHLGFFNVATVFQKDLLCFSLYILGRSLSISLPRFYLEKQSCT